MVLGVAQDIMHDVEDMETFECGFRWLLHRAVHNLPETLVAIARLSRVDPFVEVPRLKGLAERYQILD